MVTKEEIERHYAEKLGKDYDNDYYAVPSYIQNYLKNAAMDADENGLYYVVYECFEGQERVYATLETVKEDIRKSLAIDIAFFQKLNSI